MSICIARRNPVRIPRRDILVQASDTPVLALTIYQQDTDATPLDLSLTSASLLLSIYREPGNRRGFCWDYGAWWTWLRPHIVASFAAQPINATVGRFDIPLAALPERWVIGRFWYELTMSFGVDPTTGIGLLNDDGTAPPLNYAQGNMTILSGVIEFPPGACVPLTQRPELLGGIGIAS